MSWICSIVIFVGIVLVIGMICYLFVFICDLLNLDPLEIAIYILFLMLTIIIVFAIHEVVFR